MSDLVVVETVEAGDVNCIHVLLDVHRYTFCPAVALVEKKNSPTVQVAGMDPIGATTAGMV